MEMLGDPQEPGLVRLGEAQAMAQAIHSLNEKQRVVVILRYYWDLSYSEIAEILEVPLGTVKSRIDRALHSLRKILASQEDEIDFCPATQEETTP